MKKKTGMIRMTRRGIAYFAVFWAIVGLIVFGPPEWAFEDGATNETGAPAEGTLTIHFIDVGQADAAVLLCGGQTMMIDGGNAADSSLIYSYLKNTLGISRIDYMIATHPHEDHIGGLSGALNACAAGKIYSPVTEYEGKTFASLKKYAGQQGLALTVPQPGESFFLGGAKVHILSPIREYEDINDMSIVVRVIFGETSFLFTGDAEWEAEHDLIDSGYELRSTLLKVGHHGSSSSSAYAFLREVMPEYAVISVGADNSYGHPTENTLSRLRDAGAKVYRTDMNGHIIVNSDGRNLTVEAQKGELLEDSAGTSARPLTFYEIAGEILKDAQNFLKRQWNELISRMMRGIAW